MGLLGFQNRPVSGPEIVDFCGLNGPRPVQNPFKMVGREALHHFEWFWIDLGPLREQSSTIFGPETGRF